MKVSSCSTRVCSDQPKLHVSCVGLVLCIAVSGTFRTKHNLKGSLVAHTLSVGSRRSALPRLPKELWLEVADYVGCGQLSVAARWLRKWLWGRHVSIVIRCVDELPRAIDLLQEISPVTCAIRTQGGLVLESASQDGDFEVQSELQGGLMDLLACLISKASLKRLDFQYHALTQDIRCGDAFIRILSALFDERKATLEHLNLRLGNVLGVDTLDDFGYFLHKAKKLSTIAIDVCNNPRLPLRDLRNLFGWLVRMSYLRRVKVQWVRDGQETLPGALAIAESSAVFHEIRFQSEWCIVLAGNVVHGVGW